MVLLFRSLLVPMVILYALPLAVIGAFTRLYTGGRGRSGHPVAAEDNRALIRRYYLDEVWNKRNLALKVVEIWITRDDLGQLQQLGVVTQMEGS
jgi:hypothetical protein